MRGAPKEAQMSPQTETKLPPGYTLQRRDTREQHYTDERPTLRDDAGRVLAVVERWVPDVNVN
jgi:hypothetical protein